MIKFPKSINEITPEFYKFIANYAARNVLQYEKEDAQSEAILNMIRTLPKYDPSKCALSTFLYSRAIWGVEEYIRQTLKRIKPNREYIIPIELNDNIEHARTRRTVVPVDRNIIPADRAIDLERKIDARLEHIAKFPHISNQQGRVGIHHIKVANRALLLDNIPDGSFKGSQLKDQRKVPKSIKKTGSVASRRHNMPDPGNPGFPWSSI